VLYRLARRDLLPLLARHPGAYERLLPLSAGRFAEWPENRSRARDELPALPARWRHLAGRAHFASSDPRASADRTAVRSRGPASASGPAAAAAAAGGGGRRVAGDGPLVGAGAWGEAGLCVATARAKVEGASFARPEGVRDA
jgi:hypothetical protein